MTTQNQPQAEHDPEIAENIAALKSMRDLYNTAQEVVYAEERWLRSRGWQHTSDTPGCYWLWIKPVDQGRTAMCDRSTAMTIERALIHEQANQNDIWETEDGEFRVGSEDAPDDDA